MAYSIKFLQPIKQSLTLITSSYPSISHSRKFLYAKFEPVLHNRAPIFHYKFNSQRKCFQNFCFSGSKLIIGSILHVPVAFGSIGFLSHIAYAMDGHDILVDDPHLLGASDAEEDRRAFWMFARKLWLPVFFVLTVLTNLDHPIALIGIKIILFLLTTKPSPLSVYTVVDQLCYQFMRQEPHLYKVKSLYAKKVEVQDYKLLCLARVEVREQKFTLVGILGGWWALPTLMYQGAFSIFKNGYMKHYRENVYLAATPY